MDCGYVDIIIDSNLLHILPCKRLWGLRDYIRVWLLEILVLSRPALKLRRLNKCWTRTLCPWINLVDRWSLSLKHLDRERWAFVACIIQIEQLCRLIQKRRVSFLCNNTLKLDLGWVPWRRTDSFNHYLKWWVLRTLNWCFIFFNLLQLLSDIVIWIIVCLRFLLRFHFSLSVALFLSNDSSKIYLDRSRFQIIHLFQLFPVSFDRSLLLDYLLLSLELLHYSLIWCSLQIRIDIDMCLKYLEVLLIKPNCTWIQRIHGSQRGNDPFMLWNELVWIHGNYIFIHSLFYWSPFMRNLIRSLDITRSLEIYTFLDFEPFAFPEIEHGNK